MLTDPPDSSGNREDRSTLGSETLMHIKANDEQAWTRVLERYYPKVHRWATQAGLDEQAAYDVSQDVFRSVVKDLRKFDLSGDAATFGGWLRRITQRRVADYQRKFCGLRGEGGTDAVVRISEVADLNVDEDEGNSLVNRIGFQRVLDQVQSEFSEADWKAFKMSTLENYSTSEISAQLGISVNSIYLAKSRIKKRMNQLLSDKELD